MIRQAPKKGIRDLGEFGLIDRIAGASSRKDRSVVIGIGDDAAVIDAVKGIGRARLLVTTDSLVEDIHFRRDTPPESLGWKALCVNISDVAAMGGTPLYYLLSMSIPEDTGIKYIDSMIKGMNEAARAFGLILIGGDTTSSPDRIYISITVIGRSSGRVMTRGGARPGDRIFVSGTLGDSALGLRLIEEERRSEKKTSAPKRKVDNKAVRYLKERHLRPEPRVKDGVAISSSGVASSMIDVSDGLLSDLGHICEESGVGARLFLERIPLSGEFQNLSGGYGGVDLALGGGEDYELVFTVKKRKYKKDLQYLNEFGNITEIGEITDGSGIKVQDRGRIYKPEAKGYDHFKR